MMGYDSLQREMGTYQRVLAGAQRAAQLRAARWCTTQAGCACLTWRTRATPRTRWPRRFCAVYALPGCLPWKNRRAWRAWCAPRRWGRSHTVKCKLRAAALACGVLTVLGVLPRFWVALRDYGLGCPFAPLYSLPAYAAMPELPLILLILFHAGRALCGAALHGGVCAGAGPAHRQHIRGHVCGGAAAVPAAFAKRVRAYRRKVA